MPESKHTAKVQMVEGSLWKNVPKFAIPVALPCCFLDRCRKVLRVCGTRFFWILSVFPRHRTFRMIMLVYPISLGITALLILLLL